MRPDAVACLLEGGFSAFARDYPLLLCHPTSGRRAVDKPLPRHVAPYIFQGFCAHARDKQILTGLAIKRVLNMTHQLDSCNHIVFDKELMATGIADLPCPVAMEAGDSAERTQLMVQYFLGTSEFLKEAADCGERTLVVHCENERSPAFHCLAIVAAYLMVSNKWNYAQAIHYIHTARPWHHEEAYVRELRALESHLFGQRMITSD